MFAQHNNDSNLVFDSWGSLDSSERLFWLNRNSVLDMFQEAIDSAMEKKFRGSNQA